MSRRFQGGESSEILNQSSVKNEDMIQCRHEVGTVNDSDKAVPLSVIQSCPVATCETAGGTAAKVGVVNNFSDFTLLNGREVLVYFASGNTVDNPTFNLNNTGAFPLALENQLSTVSIGSGCWGDGVFLHLKYVDITVSNTRIQKWLICGHRIASQSSTQTTYADGQGRTNTVASGNMQSVTSNAVAKTKALNSWEVICQQNAKTYIHPDVNTVSSAKWIKVIMSSHESYGDATIISEYLIKLNFTPYEGTNYRGVQVKLISGLKGQTDGDLLSYYASSIGWDEDGIYVQNNTQYYSFITTVISMYSR